MIVEILHSVKEEVRLYINLGKEFIMLSKAIEFASKAHMGQKRKASGIPYISHPLSVAKTLIEHHCAEELVIAAVLHDTIEDTEVTRDELQRHFGERITSLVESVSEPDRSATWEVRKQHTIAFLQDAPPDVLLIACADKLDNARSLHHDWLRLGEKVWSFFSRPKPDQCWYYASLADLFTRRATDEPLISLSQQLKTTVEELFGTALNAKEIPL